MRENRPHGSEGGGAEFIQPSLPLSDLIEIRFIPGIFDEGVQPDDSAGHQSPMT